MTVQTNSPAPGGLADGTNSNQILDCSVAIFSSRETCDELIATISHAVEALGRRRAVLDVVVNGNSALADTLANRMQTEVSLRAGIRLRAWFVAMGDKAAAWNQYVHALAPSASIAVFIDGYARIDQGAISALQTAIDAHPLALAATGIPRCGWSAPRLARQLRH